MSGDTPITTPQKQVKYGFSTNITGGVDPNFGTVKVIGAGMSVNQTGGNLVITSGTTARAETILRSSKSWDGGIRLRTKVTLSQRIVNQSFFVELVDVIGDDLSYTITSATAVAVTIPNNPFTTANVGQAVHVGNFAGTGTFLSGRYLIASVAGNVVTFTVSGFAVGTGTCSVFGWNYYQLLYNGTTVTNNIFDTQRRGYSLGSTAATINTTAAPGHISVITGNDQVATYADQLGVSSTVIAQTIRASRAEFVPDDVKLKLQIRVANGSVAPATTTSFTIGFVTMSCYRAQDVAIQDIRPMTQAMGLPVEILRSVAIPASQSGTWGAQSVTAATNTSTSTSVNSAAGTNAGNAKASAGLVYSISAMNASAATKYVRLYNTAAAPTVGTTVPVMVVAIPATSSKEIEFSVGLKFVTGISYAITGGAAVLDATAVVAGDVQLFLNWN